MTKGDLLLITDTAESQGNLAFNLNVTPHLVEDVQKPTHLRYDQQIPKYRKLGDCRKVERVARLYAAQK